ncbi:hypothetical protein VHEMI06111 [[Torrubiella] hemipterigena]|uniref:Rhodopsin domain-containing protein n=1 Tax=[Torrubiella] hemipterigena TaxID=1531966 RepID=A0A0A1TIA5_9HYPO|nr:hypothetical protein VHEMI06111 [[Torrubiella] hemipterigena]
MMDEEEFSRQPVPPRGQILLGTCLSFGITAFLVVLLRVVFRFSRQKFTISDVCISLAVVASMTHSIFDALCVLKYGYGWHEADLPETIRHAGTPLKLFWLCQVLFKISILFTKLSLFFVYYDLLDQVESLSVALSRAVNYFTAIIVFGYYTAATFVSVFACTPIYKSWAPKTEGYCINNGAFLYSTAAANILTSLLLIGIPLPLLLRTRFRKREITQLVGLILLGLVDTACSIVRLSFIATSATKSHTDTTWTLIPSTTAASIEMNVAIIAASLVVMRPCFSWIHSFWEDQTIIEPGDEGYSRFHGSVSAKSVVVASAASSYPQDMELQSSDGASQNGVVISIDRLRP